MARKLACYDPKCLTNCRTDPNAETITWGSADDTGRFDREPRVVAMTCPCGDVWFEQVAIAGLYWIRRIERSGPDDVKVSETDASSADEVAALWEKITSGKTR
ncbi:hypothetical protein ACIBEJ_00600 [Nonomuraea sp. NPDC050790]|uniref:hypothetical protein n=1 Tax=Nonomuraea sp. NPDC050790 TaxID=3364371 RepID=UPI003792306C